MKKLPLWQRLLVVPTFIPLYLALCRADIAAVFCRPRLRAPRDWGRGVAILIPESGTPELLEKTLDHAVAALAQLDEPGEIVVLVNGAEPDLYRALQEKYPAVAWHFHAQALGFNGAIAAGLQKVSMPCVYLLNSDMRLAPDALVQLLPYREADVFALASQIFFPPGKRREETGWSDYYLNGGRTVTYEKEPGSSDIVRGTLYASGGSSLFRTDILREYVQATFVYSPFYWEDADWGATAWSEGLRCLFVPASKAVHEHRGTIRRRFPPDEIDRIMDRNALQFELRQHFSWLSGLRAILHVTGQHPATRRELRSLAVARGVARQRRQSYGRRLRGFRFSSCANRFFVRPLQKDRPTVIWVTPFAIYPPAHGGARRIAELAAIVGRHVNLVLLSDEQRAYEKTDPVQFGAYQSVHLVQGRQDRSKHGGESVLARMQSHAPEDLRRELRSLQQQVKADLVQVEFMEAAGLVEARCDNIPFVASLHDVYLRHDADDKPQLQVLSQYQAVVTCSREDAEYLQGMPNHLIPNGAVDRLAETGPSPDSGNILFMGPFRYRPNHLGILAFLEKVWPGVLASCPGASLVILAGNEGGEPHFASPLLLQKGVRVISEFVDPTPFLADCSLTINPQQEIRGSALKVAESLLAGRVCVSTREGARGMTELQSDALVVAPDWAAMQDSIVSLLKDANRRHQLESTANRDRDSLHWSGRARELLALYASLIPGFRAPEHP